MKNVLSCKKIAVVLLIITVLSVAFYAYMLARPISYGMAYHNESAYEGRVFEGTMRFYADKTMVNRNTNFENEMNSRYYYKSGYVFFTQAKSDEGYENEVAAINKNFDEAIKIPFYADKINAFRLVMPEGDSFETVYTCTSAIVFAAFGGVILFGLVGLTLFSFRSAKAFERAEEESQA